MLEQRPTDEHNTNNMKTEKTKGDILAEQIEEIIDNPNDEPFHSRMRKALDDYRAPESVLTPAQIADGWIEWHGGDCPVWGGSTPSVILRNKFMPKTAHAYAEGWTWRHCNNESDIIAYRPDPYEALKKAHSDGKVIQWFTNGKWITLEMGAKDPLFLVHSPEYYRVKPAPVMVPLGPEDVPPGSALRYIESTTHTRRYGFAWFLVRQVPTAGDGVVVSDEWRPSFEFMKENLEISRDGGKTWQKCEKPEEAK